MYVVPGHPGFVMDITASNATGRKVFHTNPAATIKQQQDAQDAQKKQADLAADQASPLGQAIPVLTGVGGLVLANKLTQAGPSIVDKALAAKIQADTAAKYGSHVADQANTAANSASGITESNIPIAGQSNIPNPQGIPDAPTGVQATQVQLDPATGQPIAGADPTGSFWTTPGSASTVGTVASGLGAAKGAYDTYDALQHGGTGLRGGLTELGASIGGYGLGPVGAFIGGAMGNVAGYGLKNIDKTSGKLALGALGPIGWGALGLDALGVPLIHKSTKQYQSEHIADLAKQDPDNQSWQQILAQRAAGVERGPSDPSKPFGGYASFDEYKQAGLRADNLTKTDAVLDTLGPDYTKYTPQQILAFTQSLIDSDNLESKHGMVINKDQAKADALKSQIGAPGMAIATAPTIALQPHNAPAPIVNATIPNPGTSIPLPPGPVINTTGVQTPAPFQSAPLPKWIIRNGHTVRVA